MYGLVSEHARKATRRIIISYRYESNIVLYNQSHSLHYSSHKKLDNDQRSTMALLNTRILKIFRRKKTTQKKLTAPETNPDELLQLGFGFWSSRVLLSAVELDLFTKLAASGSMTNEQIRRACCLHKRAVPDFTDCLVSLNFLQREGNDIETALYSNAPETDLFLDKAKPNTYVGESLEYCGSHLYRKWAKYTEFMREGKTTARHSTEIENLREWMTSIQTTTKARLMRSKMHGELRPDQSNLSPNRIFQVAFRFWFSRVLLTAVELGLFTALEESVTGSMTKKEIRKALGLKCRGSALSCFLESLIACNMLEQSLNQGPSSEKSAVAYSCTKATALFLDRRKTTFVGGILDMCSQRLFHFWADLPEALKTGIMQNEARETGWQMFAELYSVPSRLKTFMEAMMGISAGNFMTFAAKFDFASYKTMVDIGGATGQLASFVAMQNKHMTSLISTDLTPVGPLAKKWIRKWGTEDRVNFLASDFMLEDFPAGDVITMGMILHDWGMETKKMLIRKAYKALPPGGAFVAIEAIIDDERRQNTHGMCMSLNMLIEFGADEGFDFSHADFNKWCLEAGFRRTEVMPLLGPSSAVIAYK